MAIESTKMVMEHRVGEGNCGRPQTLHIIKVTDDKRGGWYRQMVSLGAFHARVTDIWYNDYEKCRTTRTCRFHRWHETDEECRTSMIEYYKSKEFDQETIDRMYPNYETVHHDSLWDFYDHIGYNHKDKRKTSIRKVALLE